MKRLFKRFPVLILALLLIASTLTLPASGQIRYTPAGTKTPETGFWMTARDGFDLLMLLDSQDATIRAQAAVISKEREESDLYLERVGNLERAAMEERTARDSDVKRAYQLGRSERRIRGGLFLGVDLDLEPTFGVGVVFPVTP